MKVSSCTYNVNIICLKIIQALLDARVHGLGASPAIVALLNRLAAHVAHAVLGREDHLSPATSLLDPLADPLLALTGLVSIGGIDEVAAQVVEGIEESECRFLRAFSHKAHPGVTEAFIVELMVSRVCQDDTGKPKTLAI